MHNILFYIYLRPYFLWSFDLVNCKCVEHSRQHYSAGSGINSSVKYSLQQGVYSMYHGWKIGGLGWDRPLRVHQQNVAKQVHMTVCVGND